MQTLHTKPMQRKRRRWQICRCSDINDSVKSMVIYSRLCASSCGRECGLHVIVAYCKQEAKVIWQRLHRIPSPSLWGIKTPFNTMYLGPTRVITPNSILIRSAVFAPWSRVEPRDRLTDSAHIGNNSLQLCVSCIRCGLIIAVQASNSTNHTVN